MERIKSNIKGIVEEFTVDEVEMLDTTGIVLKFNENVPQDTVDWICHLIKKPVLSGGASLDVKIYEVEDNPDAQIYIIAASTSLLFVAAEKYSMLKRTHDGTFLLFTAENRHDFENYEEDNADFFSSSEKQFLLKTMLDHVICEDENINTIPNFPKVKVYKNRPVLPRCIARDLIQIYPLHHNDSLKPLKRVWYMNASMMQPLNDIKNYFGESIALYFAFLGFYTKSLIPLALIGICHWLVFDDDNKAENVWFAVLNVIWATVFLELWKREGSSIVFEWGRLSSEKESTSLLEKPRAEYKGTPRVSPITGLQEPHYPTWRRRIKMYFVSYPVLILSLLLATSGMWIYFHFQETMSESYKNSTGLWATILKKIPGVIYASLIFGLNNGYRKIAIHLNDWENHKVQSSYNNHLIIKLILFYFVNSFLSLFYIAFYLCNMVLLRQHLATLLITQQLIQQIQESLIPYITFKKHNIQVKKEGKSIQVKRIRDPKNQVIKEGNMASYAGTFEDYLEIFLQFGYVFLFSAAYPLAGFWALVNNVIEIRTDGFKLCKLHQRPFTQPASSIGAWQTAFELMSIIAVMTNCGIIALSQSTQNWLSMEKKPIKYILLFVVIEHLLIIIKVFIAKIIPDVPGSITKLLAKSEYKVQQALKEKKIRHLSSHHDDIED